MKTIVLTALALLVAQDTPKTRVTANGKKMPATARIATFTVW